MEAWLEWLGFNYAGTEHLLRVISRLALATVLSALVGFERQKRGRAAGLRTHMLVGIGSALFTLIPLEVAGADANTVSQIVRGIASGIGFLGAGAILKSTDSAQIRGLTTAAGIWMTAAIGVACGAGWVVPAVLGALLALIILALSRVEGLSD